ncbi:imidazole glycerol phosphate synthase subunit HisH [Verrucomicrobiota bacterium]
MIQVVDYRVGNPKSVLNMLKHIGTEASISSCPADIEQADKLIIPGVGAFDNGMKHLADMGLLPAINRKVLEEKVPVLGICLGMQLMCRASEEGEREGLGWIAAKVIRFAAPGGQRIRVPHMGWNLTTVVNQSPLLAGLDDKSRFYFAHSYHVVCDDNSNILTTTCHGHVFASSFQKENIFGVQFHPEKSHRFGMKLLKNFAENL